jgi:hypothetical protein
MCVAFLLHLSAMYAGGREGKDNCHEKNAANMEKINVKTPTLNVVFTGGK